MKFKKLLLGMMVWGMTLPSVWAQNWQLVWSDEFDGSISSDWIFETGGGGWGNNELEYYRSENASVSNGELVITAKQESYGGYSYTSTRMKTQGNKFWTYGKVEARIALPSIQGLWPAFWMLGENIDDGVGWPACGEIDIMENVNTIANVYGTIHWADNNSNYASYGGNTTTSTTDYHVYAIEWDAAEIRWYVDGVQYHVADIENSINGTDEFHKDFFILLNLAVGGNWPGFDINTSGLPAEMRVDYVRVYQDVEGGGTTTAFIEAEDYTSMSGVQVEDCTEGGENVGYIDTGDWMAYSNITFPTTGTYLVEYRVASESTGGTLSLDLNAGSTVLGQASIPVTGGWQSWTTVSHTVSVTAGTYVLGVYAVSGGWNINWIQITQVSSASAARMVSDETDVTEAVTTNLTLAAYPNPSEEAIQLTFEGDEADVVITDQEGKTVLSQSNVSAGTTLDVSSLKKGIYILKAKVGKQVLTERIIKK